MSAVSFPECITPTVSQTKCLDILKKESVSHFRLNTSSFSLFQINQFKDATHDALDKHKLSHTPTSKHKPNIFLSPPHTHKHTSTHYTQRIRVSGSDSGVLPATGLCFVVTSRWCSIHSAATEHNLALFLYTLGFTRPAHTIKPTVA